MLKHIIVALGIAALTSTSALAATKAHNAKPAAHKVAASDTKPITAKTKKAKKAKKAPKAEQPPANDDFEK
jgi:hypothetical protein